MKRRAPIRYRKERVKKNTHTHKPLCTHERCAPLKGRGHLIAVPTLVSVLLARGGGLPLLLRSLAALAWARVGSCRAAELRILLLLGYFIRESFGIVGGGLPVTSRLHWTIILFWGGLPCLHSLAQFW